MKNDIFWEEISKFHFLAICCIALRGWVGILKSQFLTKSYNYTVGGVFYTRVENLSKKTRTLKKKSPVVVAYALKILKKFKNNSEHKIKILWKIYSIFLIFGYTGCPKKKNTEKCSITFFLRHIFLTKVLDL